VPLLRECPRLAGQDAPIVSRQLFNQITAGLKQRTRRKT